MERRSALAGLFLVMAGCAPPPASMTPEAPDAGAWWRRDLAQPVFDRPRPPEFGLTVESDPAPPPVAGGTLAVLGDGRVAVSDPERDRVYLVDVAEGVVRASVALRPGDEPGRIVEDGAGRIHVALRRGGAILDLDGMGNVLGRRAVCGAPRGVAWDSKSDSIWVACAGGELIALPSGGGGAARSSWLLDRDLRDVVVEGAILYVSRFRAAEVLVVDAATGKVRPRRLRPGSASAPSGLLGRMEPAVAWRMVAAPGGGVLLAHQRAFFGVVQKGGGVMGNFGYGAPVDDSCRGAVVHAALTRLRDGERVPSTPILTDVVLPVDVAVGGAAVYVAAAGNAKNAGAPRLHRTGPWAYEIDERCAPDEARFPSIAGQVTAVSVLANAEPVVQTRAPAALVLPARGVSIALAADLREHTGHAIFHANSGANLACASCHPEGGEDGRVWNFAGIGPRRTQSLRGGLLSTAPFHWDGDLPDVAHLMTDVFEGRMSGPRLRASEIVSVGHFLDAIPRLPPPPFDPAAAARGRALFEDAEVGCASCHGGASGTNNQTVSVGTGAPLQVPSLFGVAHRAPYLHDGCAATLADRFTAACGGGDAHGRTSALSPAQIADLDAYLDSR